jgi:hypothetical protein
MKTKSTKLTALSLAVLTCVSSGCVFSLGGGTRSQTQNATLGQQLIDLKAAKDTGAMSESEYETQKAKLMNEKP